MGELIRSARGGALVVPPRGAARDRDHERALRRMADIETRALVEIQVGSAVYETAAAYPDSAVAQFLLRRYFSR